MLNRYRTVWHFKSHANSHARISFEKREAESKEARSDMSTQGTHSPVVNFFLVLYRLKRKLKN